MAGKVLNIKVCSPFELCSGLTGIFTQSATTHTIYRYAQLRIKTRAFKMAL